MDGLVKALQKLYETNTRIRFLSDENGNILWKNGKNIDDETTIIFPDGVPYNKDEEKYSSVLINGQKVAVSGSVLSTEKKGAILWTALSLTEVLKELGSTNTYIETCYMISDAKRNVENILMHNEEAVAKNPRKRNNASIIDQNKSCYNLLKQIESYQELTTVIYNRAVNNTTINIVDLMKEAVDESNALLGSSTSKFSLSYKGVDYYNATIKANKYYLFFCIMSIIKILLDCCRSQMHTLLIKFNGETFTVIFPFDNDMSHYIDALNGDFSFYCAKMYISYLGGKVTENNNQLLVSIPFYKVTEFHSTRAGYNYKPDQHKKIAKIFLYGYEDEK
ncbi:MAG: hypothetical protein E7490_01920 [Ruminococcaceae bacterium]|nr:hypothetical protein [Oscillospiraceae bacterium]